LVQTVVAGVSPQRPRFGPVVLHLGFVVEKVTRTHTFLLVLLFTPSNQATLRLMISAYLSLEGDSMLCSVKGLGITYCN